MVEKSESQVDARYGKASEMEQWKTADERQETARKIAMNAALAKAQANAQSVAKDSRNKDQSYNYASTEGIIAEAKAALATAGLAIIPEIHEIEQLASEFMVHTQGPESRAGNKNPPASALLKSRWRLVHELGASREIHIEWPIIPSPGRPFDKAIATARTASLGYMLRDLLQLPRGVSEDEEMDARKDKVDDHEQRGGYDRPPRTPPQTETEKPKVSATQVLGALKKAMDGAKTVDDANAEMAKLVSQVTSIPDAARTMARGYASWRLAILSGETPSPEAEKLALEVNEMFKE